MKVKKKLYIRFYGCILSEHLEKTAVFYLVNVNVTPFFNDIEFPHSTLSNKELIFMVNICQCCAKSFFFLREYKNSKNNLSYKVILQCLATLSTFERVILAMIRWYLWILQSFWVNNVYWNLQPVKDSF